ncbi:MAG: AsmA family protein, partial [Candidatus Halalkalibacterium sp. M3_1C_030]
MFLRWFHKIWKYFWTILLSALLITMIFAGGLLGVLQMQATKGYIADNIENNFGNAYNAELEIQQLDGLIPFNFQLQNVIVIDANSDDSLSADTLLSIEQVNASLDVWSLFQNKISITGFSVKSPKVKLLSDGNGGYTLGRSLQRKRESLEDAVAGETGWTPNVEIVAPQLTVNDGELFIEKLYEDYARINLPEPLRIRDVNTAMFLEVSETQLFWDIENLEAHILDIEPGRIRINGQVYNDERFLEFNAFNLLAGDSEIRLNGEIDGVNLYQEDIPSQLRKAHYNIDVSSNRINLGEFNDVILGLPKVPKPIEFSVETEGIIDSLWVDQFTMGLGGSYFSINGFFRNLSNTDNLWYELKMSEVVLQKNDVEIFSGPLNEEQFSLLDSLRFEGKANGSLDTLDVDVNINSPNGELSLLGGTKLTEPYNYNGSLSGKRLNIGVLLGSRIDSTGLNFDASVSGSGISLDEAVAEFNASIYESTIDDVTISSLDLESSLVSGFFEQEYTYESGMERVEGTGWIDFSREEPRLALKGYARNIDLSGYSTKEIVPSSSLNFDYNVELQGSTADLVQGRANLDIKESVINQDTVRSHQFYVDLDSPELSNRTLRLTSSIFDLSIEGNIVPTNIVSQFKYWSRYLENSYRREIMLDSLVISDSTALETEPMVLEGEFRAKDLSLIRNYFPEFPSVRTNSVLKFNINADAEKMLLSGSLIADSLKYNTAELGRSSSRMTASFQSDRQIKEFANIDFETDIARVNSNLVDADSVNINMALRNDSLSFNQKIGTIGKNARMDMSVRSVLSDTSLKINIPEFFLGNDFYAWENDGTPQLVYNRQNDLAFNRFRFKNQNEFIELAGILSSDRADSVEYDLRNVNLSRISELIKGKFSFGGRMNGTLVTRSLTNSPSVQGGLN